MKEEKFPQSRKPPHWQRQRVVGGKASEPQRRAKQQACRGQSGGIPEHMISGDQHSPAREASLLNHQGRWGLGAEAQVSQVRSQGEDWGWLQEHSQTGVSAPRLAGSVSGEKYGTAKEARDFFLPLCFMVRKRGDSEHCLNKLQRWA